jgi:hypothetical protein
VEVAHRHIIIVGRGRIGLVGVARDAMIGDRVMLDIRPAGRHVALQAIIILACLLPNGKGQAAAGVRMTALTAFAVKGDALAGRRIHVRVMTRDTAHAAFALAKTAARMHLFHLADKSLRPRRRRWLDEDRQELV